MNPDPRKAVLLFASKIGYQTRSFDAAARKLSVHLVFVTDRCHELANPWGDDALAVRFDAPEHAAGRVLSEFPRRRWRPATTSCACARCSGKPGFPRLGFVRCRFPRSPNRRWPAFATLAC